MKQKLILFALSAMAAILPASAKSLRPVIYVNPEVTTHIIMPEQLKMVDISTDIIAGDQCTDNMIRLKPLITDSITAHQPMDFLGTVTLIGERYMAQYDMVYNDDPTRSESFYKVKYEDCANYSNPNVAMPEGEMANYAWAISNSKRKYNTVRSKAFGIEASIYNIYSIGDYFFIDLYLQNKTNIAYDISQLRVSLTDKKETKATNSQTLELTPAYVLNNGKSFKRDYRQVIVLERLTFPEEKVLNIEFSENQISGRVLTIPVEYEDILKADSFDKTKLNAYENLADENKGLLKEIYRLNCELRTKNCLLDKANSELNSLGKQMKKTKSKYLKMEQKLQAMLKINKQFKKLQEDMAVMDKEDLNIEIGDPEPEHENLTMSDIE